MSDPIQLNARELWKAMAGHPVLATKEETVQYLERFDCSIALFDRNLYGASPRRCGGLRAIIPELILEEMHALGWVQRSPNGTCWFYKINPSATINQESRR